MNSLSELIPKWKPSQPLTTSYQVLMEPPVIAGHDFWRSETGTIVC